MVVQADAEQVAGLFNSRAGFTVRGACCQVPAWVVMRQDDAGRIGEDSGLEHFPRMYHAAVDSAARDTLNGYNMARAVKHDNP